MSGGRDEPGRRDVEAEFARMLEQEGLALRPGAVPQEPAAAEHPRPAGDEEGWEWEDGTSEDDEGPSPQSRARARAAHPALGPRDEPRELDDDEVLYGDFEPPDPDLPQPDAAVLWAWTALLGGFLAILVVTVTPALPGWLGLLAVLTTLGGLVALLLRAPRRRDEEDTGAEL